MRRLHELRTLQAFTVEQVQVFDRYGKERLRTIHDSDAIASLTEACRDAEGNSPEHPHYIRSWYAVVIGDRILELMCHLVAGRPEELVGYFVRKRGDSTHYCGSFASRKLRRWFEEHVTSGGR